MERLLYNCEELKVYYPKNPNDAEKMYIEYVYNRSNSPTDDNTYIKVTDESYKKDPGTLLHVFINDSDKGLFIVDDEKHLISITCGEQFYKPLYEAYDNLIDNINKI